MCLADAERTERLYESIRKAKQDSARQGKQLGLRTSWKAEDTQWQLDIVKQAKEALATRLHDSECSLQKLQDQFKDANSVIQQLTADREELGTKATQLKKEAQHAEQQAKVEAAVATSTMEARDNAIQELSQAQTQIQHLQQVQRQLVEERQRTAPVVDAASKLRLNMERSSAESKHLTTAVG